MRIEGERLNARMKGRFIDYEPGPDIGRALRALLDDVVKEPELNTRPKLLARAKELK